MTNKSLNDIHAALEKSRAASARVSEAYDLACKAAFAFKAIAEIEYPAGSIVRIKRGRGEFRANIISWDDERPRCKVVTEFASVYTVHAMHIIGLIKKGKGKIV